MKLPWRCSQHLGGFSNMGVGASPKKVVTIGLAAVDHLVVEPDVGERLDGLVDFGRVELQLALDPLVVVLRRGGAQHEVFDPVGRRPTGGRTGLDADAPGGVAVGHDLSCSASSSSQVVGTL